jgi:urate oxidase
MARLGENCYGKSRVRLSRITRHEDHHDFNEWTVQVLLHGDFEASFTNADNSNILPTDTMKNTVYFVARDSKATTIETFAQELETIYSTTILKSRERLSRSMKGHGNGW